MAEKTRKSKFIKVHCGECKNEQVIFGRASSSVTCLVCNKPIAEPTGGKIDMKANIIEVI